MNTSTKLKLFSMVEEIANIGHWQYKIQSKQLQWSNSMYQIHGLSPDSFSPSVDNVLDFYFHSDRKLVTSSIQQAIASGNSFELSFRLIRPEGTVRHIKSKGECEFDNKGEVLAVFGVLQDITDELQNLRNIERTELAHSSLIESSNDGFWDWYIQEDYEYMSPRFWEMFGYLPEEKPHKPSAWQDLIFEEDLAVALENFEQHVKTYGKYPYSQEVRYHHKNGSVITVLCRGKVIEWDEDGNPVRMAGSHTDITEIKRAEQRLDLVIQGARDGIWDWPDMSQDEEYWSPQWKKLLGYEDDEIEAKASTFNSLVHPDDIERTQQAVKAHVEGDVPFDIEYRLRSKNGSYKWFSGKAIISDNPDGSKRMTGSITDINERKLAEIALKEAQVFQQLILDNNPDLIFVKDKNFKIISANNAFISVYPKEMRDKIIGYTTLESYDEKEAEAFLLYDKLAFKEGYSETEENIVFPDGSQRILFTKKVRFENANAEPFILGVGRDITEIKNVQEQLKTSEERFRIAIDGSSSGLWDWDISTDEVFYASRFRQILGFDGDDIENFPNVYSSFEDRLHWEDLERVKSAMQSHLADNSPFDIECRLKNAFGDYVWIRSRGQVLRNTSGPYRMAGSIDDINVNKEAQDALITTNQELERFAYMASHDLQEPLRMVVNFTGRLERDYADQLDDKAKKYIDFSANSSRRMQELINSLLEYARTGDQAQTKEEVNLNNLLPNVLENLGSGIQQSGAIINYKDLPTVFVNPSQISSLFQNIIGNGIKYRKLDEPPIIDIHAEQGNNHWRFSIKDNGIGMNQAYAHKIFQPFQRLHRKSEYPGTGMGLAICRKIIDSMGGEISVESDLDGGSTFYFTLPI